MDFTYDPKTEQLIIANATRIEYHQIKLWLTRNPKNFRWTPAFKAGFWDGKDTEFFDGKVNQGLWKECLKACQTIGAKFNILNKEEFPINKEVTLESVNEFCKDFFKNHKIFVKEKNEWLPFFPYEHQIEAAYKILRNRYALIEVSTSGGKSLIISIVYFYTFLKLTPDAKLLLIVPSISLVTQMYDDMLKYYYGQNNKIGMLDFKYEIEFKNGDIIHKFYGETINVNDTEILVETLKEGKDIKRISKIKIDKEIRIEEIMSDKPRIFSIVENPNIYIGTYQSLINYPKDFFKQFHTVVCDESHKCTSKSLKTILKRTFGHAYNRFGVSGTFPPDDSMEILYIESLMGPKVSLVEAKTLVDKGIITPIDIKAIMINHNDSAFNEKVQYIKKAGGGKESYLIEREYIHLSEKRIDFISKILQKCENNTLVLFFTIEYGQRLMELQKLMPDKEFYYIDGSIKEKERALIKEKMEEVGNSPRVLIGSYGCLSTGISINNLFNCIFADSFKSETTVIQSIGRILRNFQGKEKATIFDLVDVFENNPNNIFYKQFLERQKFYIKREYPFKIIKINL